MDYLVGQDGVVMKKYLLIIIIILCSFFPSSCGISYISTDNEQRKIAEKIMEYLNEGNGEGLKSLFCQYSLDLPDIDEQIQEAVNYFESRIVSFDEFKRADSEGSSIDDGVITMIRTSGSIRNICTDDEMIYSIKFYNFLIYKEYINLEGISLIEIKSNDELVFSIGKHWKELIGIS
jgi:hypothetical protein